MTKELYSNYVDRVPHPRNAVFIRQWHSRLIRLAADRIKRFTNVLEIGPGHGYFAEECRKSGIRYTYLDTSPAVHRKMSELGFIGHLGQIGEHRTEHEKYDVVWMSHVLEHSPTWLEARQLVSDAFLALKDGGHLVIVSPDILSWRQHFWDVDSSHGYPTSIRNVAQLLADVGFDQVNALHHRNGSSSPLIRMAMATLCLVPHVLVDRCLTPRRSALRDGMVYSWKAVFGWRQIMVTGQRPER